MSESLSSAEEPFDEPASTESPPDDPPTDRVAAAPSSRHTRWFLVGFYLLAVFRGIHNVQPSESNLELLIPFALNALLCWWALADARLRGHPIPILSQWWFFVAGTIVVPCYVIQSRGARGFGRLLLHTFLWLAASTVITHITGLALYGRQWLRMLST